MRVAVARLALAPVAIAAVMLACQPTDKGEAKTEPAPSPTIAPTPAPEPAGTELQRFSFDTDAAGAVAKGWTALETNGAGTPATWGVIADDSAPSKSQVFGVLETRNSRQTYNVALAPAPAARDVDVSVLVKAMTGETDQGGGVVLRANGADDYYIARWNPLEKNVKFYIVRAQHRDMIAKADIDLDAGKWHALRVLAEGDRFEIFVGEATVLEIRDATLPGPGRIGLWTKADAATRFDDFVVNAL